MAEDVDVRNKNLEWRVKAADFKNENVYGVSLKVICQAFPVNTSEDLLHIWRKPESSFLSIFVNLPQNISFVFLLSIPDLVVVDRGISVALLDPVIISSLI